jgi:hypothetical protein
MKMRNERNGNEERKGMEKRSVVAWFVKENWDMRRANSAARVQRVLQLSSA